MRATEQEHKRGLVRFVEQTHRDRFRASLLNEKLKAKLRQELAHFGWLDERHTAEVPRTGAVQIASMLRDRGAPPGCFVLSEDEALDGNALPLGRAIADVLASEAGALISCIPGRLALYCGEPPDPILLLQRWS